MPRDIDASRHPGVVVPLHVIEETCERGSASRPAHETAMQADRKHFRLAIAAFRKQRVETVFQVCEELVARIEALRRREPHVVCVERIGHDQMRPVRPLDIVG